MFLTIKEVTDVLLSIRRRMKSNTEINKITITLNINITVYRTLDIFSKLNVVS